MKHVSLNIIPQTPIISAGIGVSAILTMVSTRLQNAALLNQLKHFINLGSRNITHLKLASKLISLTSPGLLFAMHNKVKGQKALNEGLTQFDEADALKADYLKKAQLLEGALVAFENADKLGNTQATSLITRTKSDLGEAYFNLSLNYKAEGSFQESYHYLVKAAPFRELYQRQLDNAYTNLAEGKIETVERAEKLEMLAKAGHQDAMLQTAINYLTATGVDENKEAAKEWLTQYIEENDWDMEAVVDYIFETLTTPVEKNEALFNKIDDLYTI